LAGSVIRFRKYGGACNFVAIKIASGIGALWYVTVDGSRSSRQGIPPEDWQELTDWIDEHNWDRIEVIS